MIFVILPKGLIFSLLFSLPLISLVAQESRAIELDMEIEAHEKKGETEAAEEKRNLSRDIRRRNFARDKKAIIEVGDPRQKLPPPFYAGNKSFWGGFWELGFRANVPAAFFKSGMDWSLDNGRVAFQNGSPYLPRSVVPYQNESVLPFIEEKGRIAPKETVLPTIQLNFVSENKKWGFEYSNLPVHGSYEHSAYGFGRQFARYSTRFEMYDHKFMFKVHEALEHDRWFTWDFGLRVGGWQTNSSFLSPTLNQAGDLSETAKFVAPSAGFRIYQTAIKNSRIEFGSDMFYTTLGSFQYERRNMRDGLIDLSGNYISGNQFYKVESAKPLEMKITGIDLNLIYSFILMDYHRLSFGARSTSYTWNANESKLPNFLAFSNEALALGIQNWYTTSAFYEADGDGLRASRYFTVTNFFIGYSYVF
ncbi:hypothetical protein EHQ58_03835 [Leptospira ognonensis]|uniref:Uncharacterized protein n=2 Tax=Leptospira ognonensis TaxID=2484945 RepID=A0A4R9K7W2_9LEPT|nr:hypothetical protein EHQ58_03835 [Leptospira ognonensis]